MKVGDVLFRADVGGNRDLSLQQWTVVRETPKGFWLRSGVIPIEECSGAVKAPPKGVGGGIILYLHMPDIWRERRRSYGSSETCVKGYASTELGAYMECAARKHRAAKFAYARFARAAEIAAKAAERAGQRAEKRDTYEALYEQSKWRSGRDWDY